MDEEIVWSATITDAFSFRHAFSIIKYKVSFVTVLLTTEYIEISFRCDDDKNFHRVIILANELEKYYYNILDENNKLKEQHFICFQTETFYNSIKSLNKKDNFKMFFNKKEDYLYLQPVRNTSKEKSESNIIHIRLCNPDNICYDDIEFPEKNRLKILSNKFSEICNQALAQKCSEIKIVCNDNCIKFKAYKNNEITFINNINSNINNKSGKKEKIVIPISNIRHFTKIHNISPQGSLMEIFYSETCFKFVSKLGGFGYYEIFFIKNKEKN